MSTLNDLKNLLPGQPELASWILENCTEQQSELDTPLAARIDASKATDIYRLHTYWSKKPHEAMHAYIDYYTKPGDIVLDPFCGSGGTALMALNLGRKAVAIDRSPVAAFIAHHYVRWHDLKDFRLGYERVKAALTRDMSWLYETTCDACGGEAVVEQVVYSDIVRCSHCYASVLLFESVQQYGEFSRCTTCGHKVNTNRDRLDTVAVQVKYNCLAGCKPRSRQRSVLDGGEACRYVVEVDRPQIQRMSAMEPQDWYPTVEFPQKTRSHVVRNRGILTVDQCFTRRSLLFLARMRRLILEGTESPETRSALMLLFTGNVFQATLMQQYRKTGGGFMRGVYYVPPVYVERNQFKTVERKYKQMLKGFSAINEALRSPESAAHVSVSTGDAQQLSSIPDNSVDYVFTDPPYGDKVPFWELNFIWETWLDVDQSWESQEILVNPVRGKSEADWREGMRRALSEICRVLKPGHWCTLTYHDDSEGTWEALMTVIQDAGFIAHYDANQVIDAKQKAFKQLKEDKANPRDLIINLQKPRTGRVHYSGAHRHTQSMDARVEQLIEEYLIKHPLSPADQIWDYVLVVLLKDGTLRKHDFHAVLTGRATQDATGLWYLPDRKIDTDTLDSERERAAVQRLGDIIKQHAPSNEQGAALQDLVYEYLVGIKDKPKRPLLDLLNDYFVHVGKQRYRHPIGPEAAQLAAARVRGTNTLIDRYLKGSLSADSPAAVAEWIQHCYVVGRYETGKQLFEKAALTADLFTPEAWEDLLDDYWICCERSSA